jgi:hypothetical protein
MDVGEVVLLLLTTILCVKRFVAVRAVACALCTIGNIIHVYKNVAFI